MKLPIARDFSLILHSLLWSYVFDTEFIRAPQHLSWTAARCRCKARKLRDGPASSAGLPEEGTSIYSKPQKDAEKLWKPGNMWKTSFRIYTICTILETLFYPFGAWFVLETVKPLFNLWPSTYRKTCRTLSLKAIANFQLIAQVYSFDCPCCFLLHHQAVSRSRLQQIFGNGNPIPLTLPRSRKWRDPVLNQGF